MKPSNDREAISLIIDGLIEKGLTIRTARDGENDDMKWNGNKKEFLDHLMSCDEGVMFVGLPDGERKGYVYFVFGNDPEEVASDFTVNLEEYLNPIIDPWWN